MMTPTVLVVPDNLFGALEAWQFGLIIGIASLVIIVILLSGVVWMGGLTAKRRRENRKRRGRGGKERATASSIAGSNRVTYRRHAPKSRPRSMLEEIQMLEEGGGDDDIDFGS